MRSLEGNSTWEVVNKPTHQHTLTGRWVFKLKGDANGKIVRYKACWVVHGYKQAYGIDYDETWAGVVRAISVRALLARAAAKGYYVGQMDVTTAFLHGALDKEV
jgi:Reverse transcriptase (RNA-dependent DNA polymerase)